MPELLRAQLVLQHASGLPKDQVNMNFWFSTPGATEARAAEVAVRVRNFVNLAVAPRPYPLAHQLANHIVTNGHHVKVYEYDEDTGDRLSFDGAPPMHDEVFNLAGARDPGVSIPSEVACCLSFRNVTGATPGGGNFLTPPARRRGRIYWGPISSSALGDGPGVPSRPSGPIVDYLLASADMNLLAANDVDASWVIYSRPFGGRPETPRPGRATLPALPARTGQSYLVEEMYVDNAWATQRRRGEDRITRTFA